MTKAEAIKNWNAELKAVESAIDSYSIETGNINAFIHTNTELMNLKKRAQQLRNVIRSFS